VNPEFKELCERSVGVLRRFADRSGFSLPEIRARRLFLEVSGIKDGRSERLAWAEQAESKTEGRTVPGGIPVLVLGDSLAGGPAASAFSQAAWNLPGVSVTVRYKISSGLSRPEIFNWMTEAESLLGESRFKAVVILLGSNDAQTMYTDRGAETFGSGRWFGMYRRNVDGILDLFRKHGVKVYWIGIPPMRSQGFNGRVSLLNGVYSDAMTGRENAVFIETAQLIGGPGGAYVKALNLEGVWKVVREIDGIHLTRDGADILALHVLSRIRDDFAPNEARYGPP
jgi:hypothetical protein